jgi:hypothetical protein
VLKAIGWWVRALGDEELPAPQELVGDLASEVRARLVGYLAGGVPLIQYRGKSWCRFLCGIDNSKMGSWDLTDGIWVWPEALAHYVEIHRVVLPIEFITHALSGTSTSKPDDDQNYDGGYWLQWCEARRSPEIREGLRSAFLAAQAQVSALAADLEHKHGLSNEQCAESGCARKALVHVNLCPEHFYTAQIPLYNGLREYLRQLSQGAGNV